MPKKLSLLVFCYEFPPIGGGAGNALYHLGRLWAAEGHRVAVVTSGYEGSQARETVDGIEVRRLPVGRRDAYRGRMIEALRYMIQIQFLALPLAKEFKPDGCVAFMGLPGGFACQKIASRLGVPYIVELRGADVPGFDPGLMRFYHALTTPFIRGIWKSACRVIANSTGLKRLALQTDSRLDIDVIPNGIDEKVFSPGEKSPASDGLKLLYVGRVLESQKNISTLLEAVRRFEPCRLTVVGDGADREQLQKMAQDKGIAGRVEWKGWLKSQELIAAYRTADVFVSASRWEGMSNAALEAMACGLPLVVSDVAGNEELVKEGVNGFLFGPEDVQTLTDHWMRLNSEPQLRRSMSEHGRMRAVTEFSWTTMAHRHLQRFLLDENTFQSSLIAKSRV